MSKIRIPLAIMATLAAVFAGSLSASGPSLTSAQAAPQVRAAITPTVAVYPMPPKSAASHLRYKAQRKLPKIKRRATKIIGAQMDQPNGLMETQVVSAFHIKRIFKKRLGKAAFRSAIRIAWRESRLLPNVVNDKNKNKTNDWGLFQLNDGGTLQYAGLEPSERSLHPRRNARAARYIVKNTGWWPWGGQLCRNSVPCPD